MFINKADIVDEEMLELVEMEMVEMLNDFGFDGASSPMIRGSARLALTGDQSNYGEPSILRLVEALDHHIPLPKRDADAPLLMPIDNVLSVPGRGTIVIGTIKRGTLNKGDTTRLLGFGMDMKTNVSGMQVFKNDIATAMAGDNVGINIKGVKKGQVKKGMILAAPGSFDMTNQFDVRFSSRDHFTN